MTLQQLEYVVALDNHRHFVKAAESCFVTQPTLTLQVKKLEEEIDTLIFDRSKHPLEPTPAGAKIITKARQALREIEQLKEMIRDEKQSVKGVFRINVIPTLAPYLLPLFLRDFTEKYPEAHLIIEENQSETIIQGLKNGVTDIGILVTPLDEREIREIPLFYEPFLVYTSAGHSFYGKSKIKPEEITQEGLWLLNQGHCFRNQILNICNQRSVADRRLRFSYESGSIETLKNLVKKNMGYTLAPELSILEEMDKPYVKRFYEPQPAREVSIVVHQSFSKELLLKKLREEILTKIPPRFRKSSKFIKIKWR